MQFSALHTHTLTNQHANCCTDVKTFRLYSSNNNKKKRMSERFFSSPEYYWAMTMTYDEILWTFWNCFERWIFAVVAYGLTSIKRKDQRPTATFDFRFEYIWTNIRIAQYTKWKVSAKFKRLRKTERLKRHSY